MKIAIDATYSPTGGSLAQIINMTESMLADNEIVIYTKISNNEIFHKYNKLKNVSLVFSSISESSTIGRIIWQQAILPFLISKHKIEVLFCPGNIAPIFSLVPTVQWIGTIGPFVESFYRDYSLFKKIRTLTNKWLMHTSARSSSAVIFESNLTKKLFVQKYKVDENKSYVINIGKSNFFHFVNMESEIALSSKYGGWNPFILCVSHLYPYKNIIRMLDAFALALKTTNKEFNLLIAGSIVNEKYFAAINERISKLGISKLITFLGNVSKEELRFLYSNCMFLLFPSSIENFAYTLVEAMCCGTPITCANTTAMPETCGESALYFDPESTVEMSNCISTMIDNPDLRAKLRNKSLARVEDLPNYQQVTELTLQIMRQSVVVS